MASAARCHYLGKSGVEMTIKDKPSIAVVLPAYNEESTVAATIERFFDALPEASIWVINNRSSDKTAAIAYDTIARIGCTGGIINEPSPGKGNAVRRAFIEIDADIYVLADADLTYPADQVRLLLAPILHGDADIAVGDRHSAGNYAAENKRPLNGFGNRLVRWMVNHLFKSKLIDIMSGYRVMDRKFVKNYPILVEGFEIETDMTLHALDKRFRIVEIPIEYRDRPAGSVSKLNTTHDGLRVLTTIFNILRHYKPLLFFGSCGVMFAILGLAAGLPVLEEYMKAHYINRVPLAILASALEVVALILLAIGLILDSIAHQNRQKYERDLMQTNREYQIDKSHPDFNNIAK